MGKPSAASDDGVSIIGTCFNHQDTKLHDIWKRNNSTTTSSNTTTTMDQGTSDDYMDDLKNKLEQNHAIARKSLKRVSQYQKRRYDLKAKKISFKKGQSVWIYEPTRTIGVCSKFTSKWKGPFIVEKKIDDVTYRVKRSMRQPSLVYNVDRLALYNGRNIPSWASRFQRNIVEEADNRQ
jgi:hypothetical protein